MIVESAGQPGNFTLHPFRNLVLTKQRLRDKRKGKAQSRLATARQVKSAYSEVNFTEDSNFSRAFKAHFGITPGDFFLRIHSEKTG